MSNNMLNSLKQFENNVSIKFQLYNSLFSTLPFHRVEKTGVLLSVLQSHCEEGFKNALSPTEVINTFFEKHTNYTNEPEQLDMLFRIIQYVERQVVLFDALEDAAFTSVTDIEGAGTLKQLEMEVAATNNEAEVIEKLNDFKIQLVLTAHPTQFYPDSVLGIIHDLAKALGNNQTDKVNMYLQQLGKTPFFNAEKPTPYNEAVSLIWYLENVFYTAVGKIEGVLNQQYKAASGNNNSIINLGFWPGGDRDGNPFVTTQITLKVAAALRSSILKCYYLDIRKLKRRLTFKGVESILTNLENELYNNVFIPNNSTNITKQFIIAELEKVKDILTYKHNGLFLDLIIQLINKVNVFGFHFATLDIRQESTVHGNVLEQIYGANYVELTEAEKINFLQNAIPANETDNYDAEIVNDTIASIKGIKQIQLQNGEWGCNRYIISQCKSALNVFEVFGLFLASGWQKNYLSVDIVPLFETIEDLENAADIMKVLYKCDTYMQHLKQRNNKQTIMLGFSDGTKDGGYLMANYSIYKAKETLTAISRAHNVEVVFFDGRGGPPARGGGKTHKFYASLGNNISNKEIQLTVQGQTVSSNFGTIQAAQYNIEQLIHAGLSNKIFNGKQITMQQDEESIFKKLAQQSLDSYLSLKNHPDFLDYLSNISPVKFYAQTNIASRPGKRNAGDKLVLNDLRAIPFVGAWAQLKQNVTGYYGVGTALATLDKAGEFSKAKALYNNSLFFKTLMDNCEMVMVKCFFPLTAYLGKDAKYSELWNIIFEEFELTKKYLLLLSGKSALMSEYPLDTLSIQMREKIILPSLTIQQYALNKLRQLNEQFLDSPIAETYEKLIIRSSFGIINAGRNSV
jgi:phosphoenolpyruvate carboxylase